ncbi:hypothetical protein RhiirA4_468843 [Rhizophagus irregularis]|uniref:Uncharacterized protein n=1 Tax=Rhizophagus irregularis TaxID=588596 RepID=A0A2I1GYG8_9GLOM|nr:hypothetical protein RhiirA4_468843 [Rhizophagus irregularis]
MNLIKILTIISCFFFKVIIAQVPIYTFPIETVNYYVNGGNGIQIYVEEKGNTKKITIFIYQWDYRGTGRSDKPRDVKAYTPKLVGQDLHAVISKLMDLFRLKE